MNTLLEAPDQTAEKLYDREVESLGRILMVDDDVDIRHLLVEALTAFGYQVDDAENGARAWKALHLKTYDLLITDHEMPEMTGLQLVHKLRCAGFNLPIIFASGSALPELMAQSAQINFATVIPKPFTLDDLRRTVARVLPSHQSNHKPNAAKAMREVVLSHSK